MNDDLIERFEMRATRPAHKWQGDFVVHEAHYKGDWVRYADHMTRIAALEADNAKLRDVVRAVVDCDRHPVELIGLARAALDTDGKDTAQ